MKKDTTLPPDAARDTQARPDAYEAPRILGKRSVERTTLFQTTIVGPGGGGEPGQPIGGH